MSNILEADSIIVRYDERTVLSNAYIRCGQNEIVGLLGRNGSGKSTLLKTIFGIGAAEHKSIRVNGNWIANGYLDSNVTMLPQSDMGPSQITIGKAMQLFKIDLSRVKEAAPDKVAMLDQRPDQLSGGERRFLELLLVLFSKSKFSLLDEPFSGLSPVMIERALEIMKEVKKEKGLLLTDHMYRHVTACSDRIYCMYNARTVEIRETSELIRYGYINHDE
ncbi:MAG: ATP-binding cassette domain-containing protein [Bacteroidota bacterium]